MKTRSRIISLLLAGTLVTTSGIGGEGLTLEVKAADSQFAGEEWYDQIDTVEVNRENARATSVSYTHLDVYKRQL